MSTQPSPTRFVVLVALDPASDRPAERLVLMNRFLGSGLGAGIEVLDQAFFPNYARAGFVLLVEGPSRDVVATALEPCAGVFTTTVVEPVSLTFDPAAPATTYGVFGVNTPHDDAGVAAAAGTPEGTGAVTVRLHAQLPDGGEVATVTLVDAPTFGAAQTFGRAAVASAVTESAQVQPMGDYIAAMRAMTAGEASPRATAADAAPEAPRAAVASQARAPGAFTVTPIDQKLILLTSDAENPFGAGMPLVVAPPGTATSLSGLTYVWLFVKGDFDVVVDWSNANNFWIHSPGSLSGDYNWAYPIAVLRAAPGLDYTIDTWSQPTAIVRIRTDLSTWLGALMTTDTYDAPWPEDSYAAGHLSAYQFLLEQLPGQTPPNKGTIKEPEEIEVISYPAGAAFTAEEFADVKNHLLVEIGHFATVDQWFGPNGIINAVNTQVSVLSAGDLTEAAALMSIPPQAGTTMSLDDIFGLISAWVGVIPEAGAILSAVIDTGWAVAKAVIPQEAHQPIQAAVGAIADQLNEYLISLVQSAAMQHNILSANWGRLNEFSDGVATGRITVEGFYDTGGPGSGVGAPPGGASADAATAADSGSLPLPGQYLEAANNAWLTYVYQQLFATQHAVQCHMSFTDQPPANPWNPAVGSYQYTWSLPAIWIDVKGNWHPYGYLVYDCSTDAPVEVMAQLFAPGSALDVNPVEFFVGFNGWAKVVPHYAPGYENINENVPWPPMTRLGDDAWGALPG